MSVVRAADAAPGTPIRLEGVCPVEDAETLTALLLHDPLAPLDWSTCTQMHTAVYQAVLALRPVRMGACGDSLVARWLATPPVVDDGAELPTGPFSATRS